MRQARAALFILAVALLAAPVANAVTPEELEATVKRLEQRLAEQDKKITELQGKQSAEELRRVRREEIKKIIKEVDAEMPQRKLGGWLEDFKIYGDLRLRYHYECFNTGAHDKNIGRFRIRAGVKKTWLDEQMEIGFRLASGSSEDPTSTNQSFDDDFTEKGVWIDLAYAKYSPQALKGLTVVGGKMKNPFVHTNIIWDSDVNPEGIWAGYKSARWGSVEPFASFGLFQVEYNSNDPDATLHAYQAGGTWEVVKGVKWTSAVAYYDFGHYEESGNFFKAGGNTEAGGRLTAEEFDVLNFTNKLSWKSFNLPMSAYVDYAHNCSNELGGQSDAYAFGYKVGKNKKKGDWSLKYKYAYIEANSTPGGFTDSDFGHANRKGHQCGAVYNLTDFLTCGVNVFYTEAISGITDGNSKFLVLADLIWKF